MTIKEIIDHLDELEKFDVEDPDNREALRSAIEKLRTHPDAQPNEPLTLEELREMTRKTVWVECKHFSGWAILHIAWPEIYVAAADGNTYFIWANGEYNERLDAKLYRRPPKEEQR